MDYIDINRKLWNRKTEILDEKFDVVFTSYGVIAASRHGQMGKNYKSFFKT